MLLTPTLVGTMYGMNFSYMPELSVKWGFPVTIALTFLSAILPLIYIKKKRWLRLSPVAREKKQRIATDAAPELLANPFASLDLGPLREALDTPTPTQSAPKKDPTERLLMRRSTAHRGGKTVLVLEGFSPAWNAERLETLLSELKASLGCGGKVEARTLELQGELADRLQPLLESRGFAIKRGW